jgi:hypothetical protein
MELLSCWFACEPVFPLGDMGPAILLADTGAGVRPPRFPRTGARTQAMEGGGRRRIAANRGKFLTELEALRGSPFNMSIFAQ